MEAHQAQSVIRIVGDESGAKILIDPMRREILRLLARRPLSEKELSATLHLTPPSIGHHLKSLRQGNMISVVRREASPQGIVQKFYLANSKAFIVDTRRLPVEIKRYFFPVDIERVRVAIASFAHLREDAPLLSSDTIEKTAQNLCQAIISTARSHQTSSIETDPELIINRIYREAVKQLMSNWPKL